MNVKTIGVETLADGSWTRDIHLTGQIVAIAVDTGDLSTPDLTFTDLNTGTVILAKTGLAADAVYQPRRLVQLGTDGSDIAATYDAPVVMGTLRIAVAGAGDTKTGTIRIAYRG